MVGGEWLLFWLGDCWGCVVELMRDVARRIMLKRCA